MPRGLKPLHMILALTRWPMRVLTAVIEIATLAMFNVWEYLALRRAVALQFIRDDHPWHILQPFEELTKKLLCRLLVAPFLYKNVEDVVGFCQVVEAEKLIRQAGASPRSYPPFRRPAPYL